MIKRKGELSKQHIDQRWPWQVALEERFCTGHRYYTLRLFCADLSLCERGHTFHRHGSDFQVFCFAEMYDAETFAQRFGGELMHASRRPRWGR